MGAPPNWPQVVDQTEFSYTSTRSTFMMNVGGKVGMNITFLSPVTPNDLKRQSLQFSYLNVAVQSIDGGSHDVELYADVSGGKQLRYRFTVFWTDVFNQNGRLAILQRSLLGIPVVQMVYFITPSNDRLR